MRWSIKVRFPQEIELLLDYARQDSARQQIDVLTRERLTLEQQKRVCEEQKLIENQNLALKQAALASIAKRRSVLCQSTADCPTDQLQV